MFIQTLVAQHDPEVVVCLHKARVDPNGLAMVLEGESRWGPRAGRIAGYEISGDIEAKMTTVGALGGQESRTEMDFSGSIFYTLEIEADE